MKRNRKTRNLVLVCLLLFRYVEKEFIEWNYRLSVFRQMTDELGIEILHGRSSLMEYEESVDSRAICSAY